MSDQTLADRVERHGSLLWFAVLGGIGAWTVHLVALASLVQVSHDVGLGQWLLNIVTIAMVLVTVAAIALSWVVRQRNKEAEDDSDSRVSRLHFLATAGLLIGAINLALIILEGVYVPVLYRSG